jgi:hypothetical protein
MRVEEMALRSEIRQMLNEAGLNRETIKEMVKESINDIVKNQVNQVLMERQDEDLSEAVSKYLDSNMRAIVRNCAESTIKDKLRWMKFSVNVNIDTENEESK